MNNQCFESKVFKKTYTTSPSISELSHNNNTCCFRNTPVSFIRRIFCALLDDFILVIVTLAFHILIILPFASNYLHISLELYQGSVLYWFVSLFYYPLMHLKYKKTLGKMIGKFHVCAFDGNKLTVFQLFCRMFISHGIPNGCGLLARYLTEQSASTINLILLIGILYHAFDYSVIIRDRKYKRTLHDMIAKTIIVMDRLDGNPINR